MASVGSLVFEAVLDTSGIERAVGDLPRRMSSALDGFSDEATKLGSSLSKTVSLPLAGAVAGMMKVFNDYSKTAQMTIAVTGANTEELEKLTEQALTLGRTLPISARDAAAAQLELAKAGYNLNQTLEMTEAVATLAVAGSLNMKSAAEITASAMSIFGFEASEVARVVDVMAQAANASMMDVQDFGVALSYAGPVAASLKIPLEELSAALAILSNKGFDASMAGTAVRGIISDLVNPSKNAKKALDELGISVFNADGSFVGLANIIDQFVTKGASVDQIFTIFGDRAGPAFLALMVEGKGAVAEMTQELDNSEGAAKRMAEEMSKGLPGALDRLKASWEELSVRFGKSEAMNILIRLIDGLARGMSTLSKVFDRLGPRWTGVIAVVGGLLIAAGPLVLIIGQLAGMFALLFSPLGLVVLAIVAVIAVIAVLVEFWPEISSFFDRVRGVITGFRDRVVEVFTGVKDFIKGWWPEILGIILLFLTGPGGLVFLFTTNAFGIRDKVIGAFTWMKDKVVDAVSALVDGAKNLIGGLLNFFSELPSRIVSALGDLGGLLYGAGASLLRGMINGVLDGIKALLKLLEKVPGMGGLAGSIRNAITDFQREFGLIEAGVPAARTASSASVNVTVNGNVYGELGFRDQVAKYVADIMFVRGGR